MEAVSKLDVCCLKIGDAYTSSNVNRLFEQTEQTTDINNFICYTENRSGLNSNITVKGLPVNSPMDQRMWWNKVWLLDGSLHEEETIYVDLDVILHRDLRELPKGQIVETVWFSENISNIIHCCNINSSVMRFKDDNFKSMYLDWLANGEKIFKSFYGLDMWFYRRHKIMQSLFFDPKYIYSYKFGSSFPEDVEANTIRDDHVICVLDDVENKQEILNVSS